MFLPRGTESAGRGAAHSEWEISGNDAELLAVALSCFPREIKSSLARHFSTAPSERWPVYRRSGRLMDSPSAAGPRSISPGRSQIKEQRVTRGVPSEH